jgi:hypothetical protein
VRKKAQVHIKPSTASGYLWRDTWEKLIMENTEPLTDLVPNRTDDANMKSTKTESKRPEGITDAYLEYLDKLRASGVTNMFGAGRYLERKFPELAGDNSFHSSSKAQAVLSYWMSTFGNTDR